MARAFLIENGAVANFIAADQNNLPNGSVLARADEDGVGLGFTYHPGEEPRFRDPAAVEE